MAPRVRPAHPDSAESPARRDRRAPRDNQDLAEKLDRLDSQDPAERTDPREATDRGANQVQQRAISPSPQSSLHTKASQNAVAVNLWVHMRIWGIFESNS